MEQDDVVRRSAAEALGTGALVFVAAGAIVVGDNDLLAIAAAYGIVLAVMVTAFGHISGGHFNPAVTAGMLITRRIEPILGMIYIVSQFVGAVIAAALLRAVFDDAKVDAVGLGAPVLGEGVSVGEGFVAEIVLTFLLVLVFFATAVDERGAFKLVGGFAIGLTVFVGVLVAGPLTGAAMNPARAFGPQLVGNVWSDAWLYYVACPIGGMLAAFLYDRLYLRGSRVETAGAEGTVIDEPGVERAVD